MPSRSLRLRPVFWNTLGVLSYSSHRRHCCPFLLKMLSTTAVQGSEDVCMATEETLPEAKRTKLAANFVLQVKKLSENATVPSRGSPQAAGYDLYSAYDVKLPAEGKALVKTDIAVALPEGCYGRVAPRSGLSWKHHIDVGAGVIDRDYRGNIGVVLFNLAKTEYQVRKGDRIAQLVLERIYTPPVAEVEELPDSERGAGGFGSTGH